MAAPALLPDPTCLHLRCLNVSDTVIIVVVATTCPEALCPLCQHRSGRIHSRYVRILADLPWMGCAVRLELHVRRFFCDTPECERQIFTERLPSVVAPYARRTLRLTDVFTVIGFALGGSAGQRLAEEMGLVTSRESLLRLVKHAQTPVHPTPRVLGVDDWSFRRGKVFGTILIDLERRMPVDLLPDREAESVAAWLKSHPGVEVVSRDRGGAYAEGTRQGAPEAIQCADRFHLLKNLSEALEGFFLHKKSRLTEALQDPTQEEPAPITWPTAPTKQWEETSLRRHQERVERYHRIHELHSLGLEPLQIAGQVKTSRQTVYAYLQMKQPPERRVPRRSRKQLIELYKPYLITRWNQGCRNAKLLYQEIQKQGYIGSDSNVRRFLFPLRQAKGQPRSFKTTEPTKENQIQLPRRPFTALQVARLCAKAPDQRTTWETTYLTRLCKADASIARTSELVQAFASMLRAKQGDQKLDAWLAEVQRCDNAELRRFAQGLLKDYEAVKNGLTLTWNQGQVEGQIHRLKLLKRQSYGRAGFQMLRQRVLRRA